MDKTLLIQALIQQTMILTASLATTDGRASLAGLEDTMFTSLFQALRAEGLNNKVIADMVGLPLSTFLQKKRRLSDSTDALDEETRTQWEAIFLFLRKSGPVSRKEIELEFHNINEQILAGLLKDMTASEWVYTAGPRVNPMFIVSPDAISVSDAPRASVRTLVWATIFRSSPISHKKLAGSLELSEALLIELIEELKGQGVVRVETIEGKTVYVCERLFVFADDVQGWEAAVFDHYQAMVDALSTRLKNKALGVAPDKAIGGSTYAFGIYPGHPLEERVEGFLTEVRQIATKLREEIVHHDEITDEDGITGRKTYTFYCGQTVRRIN